MFNKFLLSQAQKVIWRGLTSLPETAGEGDEGMGGKEEGGGGERVEVVGIGG